MPANTNPIFTLTPRTGYTAVAMTAQNTNLTGAGTLSGGGTDIYTVFTAGTNGSFVQRVRFKAAATGGAAAVARIFINSNPTPGGNPAAGDGVLFDEITLPLTTVSTTAATAVYELPLNFAIPAGYRIMITLGAAVTGGWYASCIGGDY